MINYTNLSIRLYSSTIQEVLAKYYLTPDFDSWGYAHFEIWKEMYGLKEAFFKLMINFIRIYLTMDIYHSNVVQECGVTLVTKSLCSGS